MLSLSKRKVDLVAFLFTSLSVWWMCSYYYENNYGSPCTSKLNRVAKSNDQSWKNYLPDNFNERIAIDESIRPTDSEFLQSRNRESISSDFEFKMPTSDVSQYFCHNITWDSGMMIRRFYDWDPKVLQNSYLSTYKSPCFYTSSKNSLSFLPYFFLAGMPKSGTTDVWGKIIQHPQIVGSSKEPHWWSRSNVGTVRHKPRPGYFKNYTKFLKTFVRQYRKNRTDITKMVIGDGSASTLWDNHCWVTSGVDNTPGVLNIIHSVLPNAKFIVAFREPADRLFSSYRFFKMGLVKDYHRQVVESLNSMSECFNRSSVRTCTFSRSPTTKTLRVHVNMYSVFVKEFLRYFPRDQLFHFRLDEWSKNCPGILEKMFAFLEIEELPYENLREICYRKRRNKTRTGKNRTVHQLNETRKLVRQFYKPYLRELSELLEDPRYLWEDSTQD